MKLHISIRISWVLAAAASIFIFADAKATYTPFRPTPDGFVRWANSLTFDGGSTQYEFFNPRACDSSIYYYGCTFDYKERSVLGERMCRDGRAYYNKPNGNLSWSNDRSLECSEWTGPTGPLSDENGQAEYVIAVSLLAVITGGAILFLLMQKED